MKKIALIGFIGSGKGASSEYLTSKGFTEYSFAFSLKDTLSSVFGWDRDLLEGKTTKSRVFRETVDHWWSRELNIPEFTPRKAMTSVGTDLFRKHFSDDIWVLSLKRKVSLNSGNILISDARHNVEISMLKSLGFTTIRVDRTKPDWYNIGYKASLGDKDSISYLKKIGVHSSEYEWLSHKPDYVIKNDSNLSTLYNQLDRLISKI